jgi:hypothetical protein
MNLSQYIDNLNARFQTGISREHAYRGDLQQLLESLLPGVMATNEPARIDCGTRRIDAVILLNVNIYDND